MYSSSYHVEYRRIEEEPAASETTPSGDRQSWQTRNGGRKDTSSLRRRGPTRYCPFLLYAWGTVHLPSSYTTSLSSPDDRDPLRRHPIFA